MAIAFAQSANGNNPAGGTSTTVTGAFATPTTAGNTILVGLSIDGGGYTSITDTGLNKYRRLLKVTEGKAAGNTTGVEIWIAENITAVSSNVVTANQGFNDGTIIAQEFSGLAKLDAMDRSKSGTGKTLSYTTGSTATTQYPNELVFVAASQDVSGTTNFTAGAGYSNFVTDRSTFIVGAVESKVVSSAAAYSGDMTSDNSGVSGCIAVITFSDTSISPFVVVNTRPYPFTSGSAL